MGLFSEKMLKLFDENQTTCTVTEPKPVDPDAIREIMRRFNEERAKNPPIPDVYIFTRKAAEHLREFELQPPDVPIARHSFSNPICDFNSFLSLRGIPIEIVSSPTEATLRDLELRSEGKLSQVVVAKDERGNTPTA